MHSHAHKAGGKFYLFLYLGHNFNDNYKLALLPTASMTKLLNFLVD